MNAKRSSLYFFYFVNLLIILCIWSSSSLELVSTSPMIAFARLAGLLATLFALVQFVLIGRMPLIEREFGLDKLARIHHKNGRYAYVFMITHVILILSFNADQLNTTIWNQLISFVQLNEDLLKALIALVLFTVVFITSLAIVRLKLKYEAWYFVHLLVYIAILLPFFHQLSLGASFVNPLARSYWIFLYVFVLGQFTAFRWLWPAYLFFRHQFRVEKLEKETNDSTNIYITGKNIEGFSRKSGQFLVFRFLDWKRFWQAHPFSLSWSAQNKNIRITVKNSGDFTSQIQSIKPETPVFIMGPYGIFTDKVLTRGKVLFIAGGVGITPIRSMIEDFGKKGLDMILLYSNKSEKEIIFKDELDRLSNKHKLKIAHFISESNLLRTSALREHKRSSWREVSCVSGRITKDAIAEYVRDYKNRDIYLCGPVGFMDAVIKMLKEIGVEEKYIHYEKFSLH